jgi:hypothetical protein
MCGNSAVPKTRNQFNYQKTFSHRPRQHFDLIFADARHVVPSYAPASDALQRLTLDTFADDV